MPKHIFHLWKHPQWTRCFLWLCGIDSSIIHFQEHTFCKTLVPIAHTPTCNFFEMVWGRTCQYWHLPGWLLEELKWLFLWPFINFLAPWSFCRGEINGMGTLWPLSLICAQATFDSLKNTKLLCEKRINIQEKIALLYNNEKMIDAKEIFSSSMLLSWC